MGQLDPKRGRYHVVSMAKFKTTDEDYLTAEVDGKELRLLSKAAFAKFDASLLGIGDLTQPSVAIDAIAAVFDLGGFTNFCKQIEPHLAVPAFLSRFLSWLLNRLKVEMQRQEYDKGVTLWSPLPFYVKFLGDGLLVLWDATTMSHVSRRNILVSASAICDRYKDTFLPKIQTKVVDPPPILRCGLARGTVFSVGEGFDYVGSCINMAARLQRLPGIEFAFNIRGFVIEGKHVTPFFLESILVKKVSIRGIGDGELIAVLKSDFKRMSAEEKTPFRSP